MVAFIASVSFICEKIFCDCPLILHTLSANLILHQQIHLTNYREYRNSLQSCISGKLNTFSLFLKLTFRVWAWVCY